MQSAETVLVSSVNAVGVPAVRRTVPATVQPQLYLIAYGRIYSNKGAMTQGLPQRPWTACRGQNRTHH